MNRVYMRTTLTGAALIGAAMCALTGCATASDPHLTLTGARVAGQGHTALSVMIDNPGPNDVVVESVEWELIRGPLPVASGTWAFGNDEEDLLRSGDALTFTRVVEVRGTEEPDADVQLSGHMTLEDRTGGAPGPGGAPGDAAGGAAGDVPWTVPFSTSHALDDW